MQQAEKGDKPVAEVCRQHNIAENTFYRWRTRFGSMNASETARDLEVDIIKELLQKK